MSAPWWASSRSCMGQKAPCAAAASVASAANCACGCTSCSGRCRHAYRTVAEVSEQLTYDGLGEAAVGALEVGVFHHGDRGVRGAAHVIPARVDRHGQIGDDVGRADRRPDLQPLGQHRGQPEHDPGGRRGAQRGREHADLRLLQLSAAEGQRRDQQGHGEPDAGDRAGAGHGGPSDRRPDAAAAAAGSPARRRPRSRPASPPGSRAGCRASPARRTRGPGSRR